MSKVLWISDGGCTTGFGRVTHEVGERLVRDHGHEVHVLAINHNGDDYRSILDPSVKTPLWLYRPEAFVSTDTYGGSRIVELLGSVDPDVVLILNDPQMIITYLFENRDDPGGFLRGVKPVIAYIPCDGYDLPPQWTTILPQVTTVVTMSKFGQERYPGSEMIYHGVDPGKFWPVSEKPIRVSTGDVFRSKRDCKKALGLDPDGFLILRVDSNSGRKDYASTIKALIPVMERHPDIQAWFHCDPDRGTAASRLNTIISKTQDRVSPSRFFFPGMRWTFKGWPDSDMNALYSAADLFVSTSRGEGFGLTLAEAAMVGLPIVAQDISSIPEVVGPGARLIEPSQRITVPSGEDVCLADIGGFTRAIEELYLSAGARRDLGEAGRKHVLSSFDWDKAARDFHTVIERTVQTAAQKEATT